ncbi:MAG: hypothetical protein KF809_13010 [Chloroflexi bacterium]|nr:hypothetical protein [Chloroflexota bacterium]
MTVRKNVCTTSGGKFGYGKVALKLRGYEHGSTPVNYMRARGELQRWDGSKWKVVARSAWMTSKSFPANSDSYYVTFGRTGWHIGPAARNYYHRVRGVVQFWDKRSGPDKLVRTIRKVSKSC